jgi:transcriptional regulator with XRE-family HTH domain
MSSGGQILSTPRGQARPDRAALLVDREIERVHLLLGAAIREERRRRRLTLREVAATSGLSKSVIHKLESGEPGLIETYVRLAHALGLRPDFALVDPRRRDPSTRRQTDVVHAAMGEAQAAHLRARNFEVRMDEPYQHFHFAGRADVVAWSAKDAALLHIENKTELTDAQDAFGAFNAKRAYLGAELRERAGVARWRSETHVLCALWSADMLRQIRRHRASFESVCPNPPDTFEQWWSGAPPTRGIHSTLILFDPLEGSRSDRRRWAPLSAIDTIRPRYRDYAEAAEQMP